MADSRILIVDDDAAMCAVLEEDLLSRGYAARSCRSAEAALAELERDPVDAVVTDLNMPGIGGHELCRRVAADWPDVPVIVVTAFGSLDAAVAAIRAGAYDFVSKPLELELLALTVARAVERRQLRGELDRLRGGSPATWGLQGESAAMRRLREQIARIAPTPTSVLVLGESGTGKERVARAIHAASGRSGPFVAVNCAALPAQLMESELFGHVRGAFTGADADRIGLLREAQNGTLFLDEIGELPAELQPKILRALEARTVRPIGGTGEQPFDTRLVSATNRDLEQAIDDGQFRADLYYRVNTVTLALPPLRTRGNDVIELASQALSDAQRRLQRSVDGMSEGFARKLLAYAWPGNVRQLRNVVERALLLTRHRELVVEDLPPEVRGVAEASLPNILGTEALTTLDEIERRYVLHVLAEVQDNKAMAARILGVDRKTLYRKLRRWQSPDGA